MEGSISIPLQKRTISTMDQLVAVMIERDIIKDDDLKNNQKIASENNSKNIPDQKIPIAEILELVDSDSRPKPDNNDVGSSSQSMVVNDAWTIYEIGLKLAPKSWESVFQSCLNGFREIDALISREVRPVFPLKRDLFKVFELCKLDQIKVVIFGQDPYPGVDSDGMPTAQGIAFSIRPGISFPSSLGNIFKELKRSIPGFKIPTHGDLTPWVQQGVFLLNTCLTVRSGVPDSHGVIWMEFIQKVIAAIRNVNKNCIFVTWGVKAQKLEKVIPNGIILRSSHPSGRSAYQGNTPFYGCNHFVEINEILIKQGKSPINWNLD